jgi:hypothetical protein
MGPEGVKYGTPSPSSEVVCIQLLDFRDHITPSPKAVC